MLKQSVKDKLEQLKLKGFLRTAETSLDQMLAQSISFEEFLDFCLEAELNDRTNRKKPILPVMQIVSGLVIVED